MADARGNGAQSRRRFLAAGAIGVIGLAATPACARSSINWGDRQLSWIRPKLVTERPLLPPPAHRRKSQHRLLRQRALHPERSSGGRLAAAGFPERSGQGDRRAIAGPAVRRSATTETEQPFEIYSAYRSPETNALLRREGWGVACNSLHMQGMAIDIGLPGREARDIANCALSLQRGGVGIYRRSTLCTWMGEVRTWRG